MPENKVIQSTHTKAILLSLLNSTLIILFLFYIDEGYYNFNWMQNIGNWIAFTFYILAFSTGQLITHQLILTHYKGSNKIAFTSVIGIPLGFGLIIALFYFAGL